MSKGKKNTITNDYNVYSYKSILLRYIGEGENVEGRHLSDCLTLWGPTEFRLDILKFT